jgi:hypothetical protein
MPSHERQTLADPARRARLRAGLWLAAGLAMSSAVVDAAPAVALPAPPAGAVAVDWDHFGEPSLSAARRANVATSRELLPAAGVDVAVDTQLYRLPGDAVWERVLGHYQQKATPGWKPAAGAARVDPGNPARQQRFTAADDPAQRFAIVWLPPAGEVRDGLLMVLRTTPAR